MDDSVLSAVPVMTTIVASWSLSQISLVFASDTCRLQISRRFVLRRGSHCHWQSSAQIGGWADQRVNLLLTCNRVLTGMITSVSKESLMQPSVQPFTQLSLVS